MPFSTPLSLCALIIIGLSVSFANKELPFFISKLYFALIIFSPSSSSGNSDNYAKI